MTQEYFKHLRPGDKVSRSQYNRLVDKVVRSAMPRLAFGMRSGMGFNSRRQPLIESAEAITPYARWPFAGIDGGTDVRPGGYDATLVGHANTDCDILQLDGTGDNADLDSHVGGFTGIAAGAISIWFNPTAINGILFGLTHGNLPLSAGSLYISYNASKRIQLYCYNVLAGYGHPGTSRSLDLHRWHHLLYVSDATGNRFYIDGEQETSLVYTFGNSSTPCFLADATIDTVPDAMRIGCAYYNSSVIGEFAGGIADVQIYNNALTQAQALEIYRAGNKRYLHADEIFGACRIFEVQSAGTGDGIYNCYAQTLDATEWDDTDGDSKIDDFNTTSVEVLNLAEFDPEATYVAQLAAGDVLLAFRHWDDEAGFCWVGMPFRQNREPRIAWCKNASGAGTTMDAYLDKDGTGTEITVYFLRTQGNSANLEDCSPLFADGDPMKVTKMRYDDGGVLDRWVCDTVLQPKENCVCET